MTIHKKQFIINKQEAWWKK